MATLLSSHPRVVWRPTRRASAAWGAVALVLATAFLFVDVARPPVMIWDESFVAINALEMHLHGWSVVTTAGGAPDLVNTKPPLAVWLTVAAMNVLGPTELALRLPAIAAGLATLLIVFGWTRTATRSAPAAALAVALLAGSVLFFGPNGVRAGYYDAPLTALVTAALAAAFAPLHRRRPAPRRLALVAALVAAALMTKGAAVLIPAAGPLVYLLATRRLPRILRTPRWALAGLAALVPLAAFLLLREHAAPGFLAALTSNDVTRRIGGALDEHGGPPTYYLDLLCGRWLFAAGPAALLAPAALPFVRGRERLRLLYALACGFAPLLVLGVVPTKLPHYALPALPWLAVATAMAARVAWRRRHALAPPARAALMAVLALVAVEGTRRTLDARYVWLPTQLYYPEAGYGDLLDELRTRGRTRVTLAEPGIVARGFGGYAPLLQFYGTRARAEGLAVTRTRTLVPGPVATCDRALAARLLAEGGYPARWPGCAWR